ncbi:chorismate-binding protein [Streptomyces sp. NPDC002701]|uniref:chorismate-binding protein n=1 Tax=Streptomyces sp. NPDC002701 TaxID=3364661 RepID=UPI0036A1DF12
MKDLSPSARFASLHASGVLDVTDDPRALDSSGFWVVVADFEGRLACARFRDVRPLPRRCGSGHRWAGPGRHQGSTLLDRAAYTAGVRHIRERIAAGDVYQANLCRILSAPVTADADIEALAGRLADHHHAPCAAMVRMLTHGVEVVSASPELFLRRTGRVIESGPISAGVAREIWGKRCDGGEKHGEPCLLGPIDEHSVTVDQLGKGRHLVQRRDSAGEAPVVDGLNTTADPRPPA